MAVGFPPTIRYPTALDDDTSLYLVFNTTETLLTDDNQPWSEEIAIDPQDADSPEIWADNGFATVSGELLYYDAVDKNSDDRVYRLKRCARNLGGSHTQYNVAGTDIRGFVVAEHHEQLAAAAILVETFLLDLGEKINEIADQSECFDDGNCPNVNFSFDTVSSDPCDGTVIDYNLEVAGNFNSFKLDFGDGITTTSTQNGEHRYAPNATVDPVVFVSNNFCQVIVTGVDREADQQPESPEDPDPLEIIISDPPVVPNISCAPIDVPDHPDINIPPTVFPCFDFEPNNISIGPISIGDINIPSTISVTPPDISITPISIIPPDIPTVISIIPPTIDIPSIITVIDDIPNFITVTDSIPNTIIVIDTIPNVITIIPPVIPGISVNWGTPPVVSCVISCLCPSTASCCPSSTPMAMTAMAAAADGMFADDFDPTLGTVEVDYDFSGIPSKIIVEAPEIPAISIDTSSMPTTISVVSPKIPEEIKLRGAENIPSEIRVLASDMPKSLKVDASDLPKSILLDASAIPETITVLSPDIPSVITIDASGIPESIQVEGIPKTISVEGFPDFIPISIMNPEVEMVYKGAPIEVVVKLDMQSVAGEGEGDQPCFMLVPCRN